MRGEQEEAERWRSASSLQCYPVHELVTTDLAHCVGGGDRFRVQQPELRTSDLRIDQGFDVGEEGGELLRAAGADVLPRDLSQSEGVQHEVQIPGRLFE